MRKLSKNLKICCLLASVLIMMSAITFSSNTSAAIDNLTGYFSGLAVEEGAQKAVISIPDGETQCGKSQPVTYDMVDKDLFISTILAYYGDGGCGEADTVAPYMSKEYRQAVHHAAGEYIIQSMRGVTDYIGEPDSNDIADWKARIYNNAVTIKWEDYAFKRNAGRFMFPADQKDQEGNDFKNKLPDGRGLDVAFYDEDKGDTAASLVFYYNLQPVYVLKGACANPLGSLPGLPVPADWKIEAVSSVKVNSVDKTVAEPGDIIKWTHNLKNKGPGITTSTVHSNLKITGFSASGEWAAGDVASGAGVGIIRTIISDYATYTVVQDDVGHKLCEQVLFDPFNQNGGTGSGNNSCVTVAYGYELTPSITSSVSVVVEANTSFSVTPTVINKGPTKSQSTQWQITQMIVPPTEAISNLAGGNSAGGDPITEVTPCVFYAGGSSGVNCSQIGTGNTVFNEVGGRLSGDVLAANTVIVGNLEVGTKVCLAFSVQPYAVSNPVAANDSQWRHSAVVCLVVGKKPKTQIWGGDLWVGGAVRASNSVKNINNVNRTFGSWAEYGIFAADSITGIASGSVFAGGPGPADATVCKYNVLSFVNAVIPVSPFCIGGGIGNYSSNHSLLDVAASFSGAGTIISGNVTPNDRSGGIYSGDNLTLATSELVPGKSIIIKASGTVTIAGNQTYDQDNDGSKYKSGLQLPQLVIIADKIIINSDVTNVDAWLVAKGNNGTIETCNIVGNTANKCNSVLTVNGPVVAQRLYLRRTAGSEAGAASGDPAEIFNLRADAYLWAAAQASINNRIQTVYTTELPPRF